VSDVDVSDAIDAFNVSDADVSNCTDVIFEATSEFSEVSSADVSNSFSNLTNLDAKLLFNADVFDKNKT
jgi:hypothetical protein